MLDASRRWYSDIRNRTARARGPGALSLHEARDPPVQLELGTIEGEGGGARDALREDGPRRPLPVVAAFGEIDHRLLGAPQVERRPPLLHRLPDGSHVGVGVPVEQLQEQREVLRIALVRGGGQQQQVVRAVAQQFAEPVALALVGLVARRHAVRLVHDDQIPAHLLEAGQDLGALREVERGDDLVLLHPLVDAELFPEVAALQHHELLVELLPEFALPLEREVRGAHHENPLDESPQLQFADEQAGHDGLARSGIVGQQEAHARELEEMLIDRFELVRQRVHPRDGQAEVRVELVTDAQRIGLDRGPQEPPVTPVGESRFGDCQVRDVLSGQPDPAELLRLSANQTGHPDAGTAQVDGLHLHRLAEERPGEDLPLADRRVRGQREAPLSCTLTDAASARVGGSEIPSPTRRSSPACAYPGV